MKNFDGYIKEQLGTGCAVPGSVHARVESTLASLPQKNAAPHGKSDCTARRARRAKNPVRLCRAAAACAACFFTVFLFILPNVSLAYAERAGNIPVIGSLVGVFTIRSYTASDDGINTRVAEAAEESGGDIVTLTETALGKFYEEYGGAPDLQIDCETVTDTEDWFTLKLSAGDTSSGEYDHQKFYNIDRSDGSIVTFGDLFDADGMVGIAGIVVGKMEDEMAKDSEMLYWVDDITVDAEMLMRGDSSSDQGILIGIPDAEESVSDGDAAVAVIPSGKIPCVSPDQNFYFTEDGDLVIFYDEYTVAPGFMGCPEIVISKEEYEPFLASGE